jgi:hypothetical protein
MAGKSGWVGDFGPADHGSFWIRAEIRLRHLGEKLVGVLHRGRSSSWQRQWRVMPPRRECRLGRGDSAVNLLPLRRQLNKRSPSVVVIFHARLEGLLLSYQLAGQ